MIVLECSSEVLVAICYRNIFEINLHQRASAHDFKVIKYPKICCLAKNRKKREKSVFLEASQKVADNNVAVIFLHEIFSRVKIWKQAKIIIQPVSIVYRNTTRGKYANITKRNLVPRAMIWVEALERVHSLPKKWYELKVKGNTKILCKGERK